MARDSSIITTNNDALTDGKSLPENTPSLTVPTFLSSLLTRHNLTTEPVLFLAAILDLVLVLVFWTKMLFSFSQILVTSICDSFSPVLVNENSDRF